MPKATEETRDTFQLLDQVRHRVEVLRQAVATLTEMLDRLSLGDVRLATASKQMSNRMLGSSPVLPWRLVETGKLLITPTGRSITLSRQEYQLLRQIFSSPDLCVRYEDLRILRTYKHAGTQQLLPSRNFRTMLSRFRKKIRDDEIDFPLYSVRGAGLQFTSAAEISDSVEELGQEC